MTSVTITKRAGHITGIKCLGHTGYGLNGEDIVCAALSSIVQTALLGLLQVASVPAEFKRDDDEGMLEFTVPALGPEDRRNADMILNTMLAGLNDLNENFSRFISIKIKQV